MVVAQCHVAIIFLETIPTNILFFKALTDAKQFNESAILNIENLTKNIDALELQGVLKNLFSSVEFLMQLPSLLLHYLCILYITHLSGKSDRAEV